MMCAHLITNRKPQKIAKTKQTKETVYCSSFTFSRSPKTSRAGNEEKDHKGKETYNAIMIIINALIFYS